MKKIVFLSLVCALLVPLLLAGCGAGSKTNATVDLSLDDFAAQNNIVKDVTVSPDGTLTVTLGSNGSTGFQWGDAVINKTDKIQQTSRKSIEPTQTGLVGAAGKENYIFTSKAAGNAVIKLSYGRPWEGGEKGTYTLTINVTIK